MSGNPAAHGPSPRTQARLFVAACYTVTVLLLVGSCWLFLGNADQLVPGERVESEAMRQWRTDDRPRAFAGGLWRDPAFWRSVNLTLTTSTLTALLAALVGIPAAYALSRYRVPGRRVIDVLFSSVIVLPASSVGLCLIVMFQYGPLYELQQGLGFRVAHTLVPGIVAAQLVLSLAMGMSAWRAAFDGVNPRFEQVARSLGSSPWRAFRTVTLPAAKTGLITGFILAWVRAMAEFGSVLIFCGTFRELPLSRFSPATQALGMHQADFLSVAMWSEIEYGNVEYGFGIGFALVAISAVSVYTIHRIGGKGYVW